MNRKHLIYTLILALLPMLAASCVADGIEPCPAEPDAPGYLTLAVSTATTSRAAGNPTGGEQDDGYEHGRNKENSIYDLSIFLYVDGGDGLDGDYAFVWRKFVTNKMIVDANPDHPYDHIYSVNIPLTQAEINQFAAITGTMRLAVVANGADLTGAFGTTQSLVRDVSYAAAWVGETAAKADRFLMAPGFNGAKNANRDGLVTKTVKDDKSVEYSATVNLERVAARIDLRVTPDNITDDNKIQYTVQGTSGNTLTLLNAIPVNLMQQRSYLVKQVATAFDATWQAAGDETMDANGHPTNYVITPAFVNKPTTNNSLTTTWYGDSRAANLRTQGRNPALSPVSAELVATAFDIPNETGYKAITLAYSNENTHKAEVQLTHQASGATSHPSDYLTGLLFRAQYHPAKIWRLVNGTLTEMDNYVDGQSFVLFRTVETEVSEAKNLYFESTPALDKYLATLPAGGKYETQTYNNGICYYNVWIRHANTDVRPEENFPMKYGIVRNNIYRISLNFHGIGQPTPEIVEPQAVTARIYVIKWNFRPQPEIIM